MRSAILMVLTLSVVAFASGVTAGSAPEISGPAEVPPASYPERQYIDSRGCVFIRAGIGGVTTWVPRVDRQRNPVCGHMPSLAAARREVAPVVRVVAARPVAVTPRVAQQAVRVVPQHVYDNRQNTRNVAVPKGYRPVWTDDRLNPHRAERTLAPSLAAPVAGVPRGYRGVWQDDRLNLRRAQGTAQGEAAMGRIWDDSLPRELRRGAPAARVVTADNNARNGNSPYWEPPVGQPARAQLSTRSDPALGKPLYVRLAAYGAADEARGVAEGLARGGLSMRLGKTGNGTTLVLAGPYGSEAEARAALAALRGAGYPKAALLR
ncbi:SPOR domain-containing protein [Seohaeicola zhoushanensis]|uniref:SPOR domain-containing protein n=1 Tax=Seohaeicola zhoushanensis TaxID=1569283 RepID=A0A8J3GZ26_9RHOB|nr:SPOR domain-containing protein [Seohaeicola zhoushanensis]GHF60924.1 hypothetical protein GCM10017056_35410 [Seohaeicola zhoushanensis]